MEKFFGWFAVHWCVIALVTCLFSRPSNWGQGECFFTVIFAVILAGIKSYDFDS